MLRTFSDNPTCRHIVFGGCHDAGYLLNLEHFKHNPAKSSRITLLETTPAYRGFTDLANFKRARFDDVFKNEPLPEYLPPVNGFGQLAVQSPVQPVVQPLSRSATNNTNPSPTFTSRAPVASPSPSVTPVSVAATGDSNGDSSWGKQHGIFMSIPIQALLTKCQLLWVKLVLQKMATSPSHRRQPLLRKTLRRNMLITTKPDRGSTSHCHQKIPPLQVRLKLA
jgi:hypothetical protein